MQNMARFGVRSWAGVPRSSRPAPMAIQQRAQSRVIPFERVVDQRPHQLHHVDAQPRTPHLERSMHVRRQINSEPLDRRRATRRGRDHVGTVAEVSVFPYFCASVCQDRQG